MRGLTAGLLAAALLAPLAGCTTALKKGSSFVFGPTADAGEWMSHDCWKQRDAKDGGEQAEAPRPAEREGK